MPAGQPAICLRQRELREHDAVVEMLTRDVGRLSISARGVRRPKAKLAPACQSFCLSEIELAGGRGMPTLTSAVVLDSHYGLRADLHKSAYASYLCELCDRCLPEGEPHSAVFELLGEALQGLIRAGDGAAWCHSFELRFLAELGWEPVLDRCARSGVALGPEAVFCPAAGGLMRPELAEPGEQTVPVDPRAARAMRRLLRPDAYDLDLAALAMLPELADSVRRVVRAHLAYHVDAEIRSLAFLDELRQAPS